MDDTSCVVAEIIEWTAAWVERQLRRPWNAINDNDLRVDEKAK